MIRKWKPGPTDIIILVGAITNLLVITFILAYYFLGK